MCLAYVGNDRYLRAHYFHPSQKKSLVHLHFRRRQTKSGIQILPRTITDGQMHIVQNTVRRLQEIRKSRRREEQEFDFISDNGQKQVGEISANLREFSKRRGNWTSKRIIKPIYIVL
jgi:hypothetical protein